MKSILLFLVVITLTGCGTAKTIVLEPPKEKVTYSSVAIIPNNPTVQVPDEVTEVFEGELNKSLFDEGPFSSGDGLKLLYTFVQNDEGDRFERWFWGGLGNAGEASVTVMVRYVNDDGDELAKTQVEGRIGSGFFGGSIDSAIKEAARDVATYTIANFK